jgi:hypothetical protein
VAALAKIWPPAVSPASTTRQTPQEAQKLAALHRTPFSVNFVRYAMP